MKKCKLKSVFVGDIHSPRNHILIEIPISKLKRGDYVSLDIRGDTLFKVIELDKHYVLLEDTTGTFYERIEYIEYSLRVINMSGGLLYYLAENHII